MNQPNDTKLDLQLKLDAVRSSLHFLLGAASMLEESPARAVMLNEIGKAIGEISKP